MNALPGINLWEFTVAKSIPAPTPPIVLYISLGFLKNLRDVALFSWGLILSAFNIAIIFSYLPVSIMFESKCVFLSLGNRFCKFLSDASLAYFIAFYKSSSSIPAPLNKASLCNLFSSSYVKNSYCNSLNRIYILSISLSNPLFEEFKSVVVSANFKDILSIC
jgi:hypothetical protein